MFAPLPDPKSAIELAKTFFAGISAVAASIGVWQKSRDRKAAAKVFDETLKSVKREPNTNIAAQQLISIIPKEVMEGLERRAETCWTGYREVLDNNFLPSEVDAATEAVQLCVCRELNRINTLNGEIPSRWQGQWERYNCNAR